MTPTTAPMAWTFFALSANLTKADWLEAINRMVNNGIDPNQSGIDLPWMVAPKAGVCHDYAVTKREMLLHFGYHAGELLLCECTVADGQHHMVVIAQASSGWMVLDSIVRMIVPLAKMSYKVVRQQSVADPNFWENP